MEQSQITLTGPPFQTYTIIRENWLTRKLDGSAASTAGLLTMAMILASLLYWSGLFGADLWMPATREAVFVHHEWWRAWTTLLVHGDTRHLFSNAFLFFIMGSFLIGYFGFLVFPLVAFLFGGFINLCVLAGMPSSIQLIGVSGVVFWMGGCWLALYFLIDRGKSLLQRALRAFGVGLALFMPAEAFDPSISYLSHLYGFIFGVIFGLSFYFVLRPRFLAAEVTETIYEADSPESF